MVAMTDLIPSLSGYATLASPALTDNATLNGLTILTKNTMVLPAYASAGQFIELGCTLANMAGLKFHSNDANMTVVNYDT